MADHFETYGSAKLKVLFMDDEKGKGIKKDTLFENLYDFWTSFMILIRTFFTGMGRKFVR